MWFIIGGIAVICAACVFIPLNGVSSKGLGGKGLLKAAKNNFLLNIYGVIGTIDDILYRRRNRFELPKKNGDVAVITGGARGIGLEVVKQLLKCEMNVVIGCRNVKAGEDALNKIRSDGIQSGNAKVYHLDMESMLSVRDFACKVKADYPKIHVLINNAGIMLVPYKLTGKDNDPMDPVMESHFSVNYVGHFLLTHLLLPNLKAGVENGHEHARVVNVSSIAHMSGEINLEDIKSEQCYIPGLAYAQSKLAQILFARHLEKVFRESEIPIHIYAVHPGVCDTDLFEGTYIKKFFPWIVQLMFKHPKRGATTIMFPAVSPKAEKLGGCYLTNCRAVTPSGKACDEKMAKELFNFTCNLLSIENFLLPKL